MNNILRHMQFPCFDHFHWCMIVCPINCAGMTVLLRLPDGLGRRKKLQLLRFRFDQNFQRHPKSGVAAPNAGRGGGSFFFSDVSSPSRSSYLFCAAVPHGTLHRSTWQKKQSSKASKPRLQGSFKTVAQKMQHPGEIGIPYSKIQVKKNKSLGL